MYRGCADLSNTGFKHTTHQVCRKCNPVLEHYIHTHIKKKTHTQKKNHTQKSNFFATDVRSLFINGKHVLGRFANTRESQKYPNTRESKKCSNTQESQKIPENHKKTKITQKIPENPRITQKIPEYPSVTRKQPSEKPERVAGGDGGEEGQLVGMEMSRRYSLLGPRCLARCLFPFFLIYVRFFLLLLLLFPFFFNFFFLLFLSASQVVFFCV